jgi:excisionase family DNA binding protein
VTEDKTPPRFMAIKQAAGELNVSESQIRGMLKAGDLRGIQIGPRGPWHIGTADFERYIEEAYARTPDRVAAGAIDDSGREQD